MPVSPPQDGAHVGAGKPPMPPIINIFALSPFNQEIAETPGKGIAPTGIAPMLTLET